MTENSSSEDPPAVPIITPEIAERLAHESREISRGFRERIKKMLDIPPEEWRKVSR